MVYTSAKTGSNCDLLRQYVLHRAFPDTFKCDAPPQPVDRTSIFLPTGYDSFDLVKQTLVGAQPRWSSDRTFEKIVPPPEEPEDPVRQPELEPQSTKSDFLLCIVNRRKTLPTSRSKATTGGWKNWNKRLARVRSRLR